MSVEAIDEAQATGGNYASIFAVCGFAYITAWTIIHLLAPRLEPVRLGSPLGLA